MTCCGIFACGVACGRCGVNDPLFSLMVASSFSVHGASRHHCLHLEDARGFVPLFTVCPISFLSAQRATHLKLCDGATAGDALGTEKLWAGAVLLQLDELCQEVAKVVGAAVVVCEGLEGIRRGEGNCVVWEAGHGFKLCPPRRPNYQKPSKSTHTYHRIPHISTDMQWHSSYIHAPSGATNLTPGKQLTKKKLKYKMSGFY